MSIRCPRALLVALLLGAPALAQTATKLSVSSSGSAGNGDSAFRTSGRARTITSDGRYVVFSSAASNLVQGDTNGWPDIFLRDTVAGTTTRVSSTSSGVQPNGACSDPTISDDGRFIAYASTATNLASGDFNNASDVFVLDRLTGLTTIVSVANSGQIGNGASGSPAMSADGTRIAYASGATNLVSPDTNGRADVFSRNLVNNVTRMLSVTPGGVQADGDSSEPAFSGDGKWVAFQSDATNLVAGDSNGATDVFVVGFATGVIELISRNSIGVQADAASSSASLSFDGNVVAFASAATNLSALSLATPNNVYARDRALGTTVLLNAVGASSGNGDAGLPSVSSSGAFVAFTTSANNLDPSDIGPNADAYLVELSSLRLRRVSVPVGTLPADSNNGGVLAVGGVSDDGRYVTFGSAATNLAPGEPSDMLVDVYSADLHRAWFRDFDGDTYGDAADFVVASFAPAGYVDSDTDCDDTNPQVNPAATEVCNGIDDNCDMQIDETTWVAYCTTSISQNGCQPLMTASGMPSVNATSGFLLHVDGLDGQRTSAVMYSLGSTAVAWAFGSNSTRCITFPWSRGGFADSGGTPGACDGAIAIDWLAFMANHPGVLGQPIGAGDVFYAQGWFRDPGAVKNNNLTDAITFGLCP